jgi:hypothetical protein
LSTHLIELCRELRDALVLHIESSYLHEPAALAGHFERLAVDGQLREQFGGSLLNWSRQLRVRQGL